MQLTVAICTYRRLDMLRQTLQSLCDGQRIDAAWELLLIDNACEPQVEALAKEFTGRLPLRYIAEPTTGTSHARNRAVNEAAAPIVLFTDDDVTFDKDWLGRMWRTIQEQPQCKFWGGRVEPVWMEPKPAWFDPGQFAMLGDTIVQYVRGREPRRWDPASDPPFYTANLAFRCEAIRAAGLFDTTVGHSGKRRMGMEDSLMVRAISAAGGEGWYVGDAVVHHPVPAERMRRSYARGFAWRQGWLSVQMTRRSETPGFGPRGRLPKWFFRVAATELLRGVGQMLAGLVTFHSAKRFAGSVRAVFNLSKLWHAMRK